MNKEKKIKLYNELASIIYNDIKDYIDSNDDLTYTEVVGVLEQVKKHFSINNAIDVTNIMIKRDIRKNFKNENLQSR